MKTFFISIATSALLMVALPSSAQEKKKNKLKNETETVLQANMKTGLALIVNSNDEKAEMTRAELGSAVFTIFSYDKNADSGLRLKEFTVKFPEQRAYTVTGNVFNDEARRSLSFLKKGDEVVIFGAVAEIPNNPVKNAIVITLKD